ncbi:unnamed protein product, partial [Polarella glacialis]
SGCPRHLRPGFSPELSPSCHRRAAQGSAASVSGRRPGLATAGLPGSTLPKCQQRPNP